MTREGTFGPVRFAPVGARLYEASLIAVYAPALWALTLPFHGVTKGLLTGAFALGLVAFLARSGRLAMIVDRDGITIRNYLRTYRVPWSDVEAVVDGAILIRRAVGLLLRDGTVRSIQVTQTGRRVREHAREELRRFAPSTVVFREDERAPGHVDACPSCGKRTLADDPTTPGTRHCWSCGADFPKAAAAT